LDRIERRSSARIEAVDLAERPAFTDRVRVDGASRALPHSQASCERDTGDAIEYAGAREKNGCGSSACEVQK
jgi:hypothetical protein